MHVTNKELFLKDFLEIFKKWFLGGTYIGMYIQFFKPQYPVLTGFN